MIIKLVNRFKLDNLSVLARQLEFSPTEIRQAQVAAAEALIFELKPEQTYPFDFIVFRVTGYDGRSSPSVSSGNPELLTGMALQHDLSVLVEEVSSTLDLQAAEFKEPVLTIEDVTTRFNVTAKTIQRWRKRGLASRKFIFGDGKKRVGFLLSSVERFVNDSADEVTRSTNFSQLSDTQRDDILRNARRLAEHCGCCVREISRRLARRFDRSPLTILHTIRKYDQENPARGICVIAADELAAPERQKVAAAAGRGVSLRTLGKRVSSNASAVYRAVLEERIQRLSAKRIRFIEDSLYLADDAESQLRAMVDSGTIGIDPTTEPTAERTRTPKGLPPYLADLYRVPLLTRAQERALFLKLNFHKFRFATLRGELDPEIALRRDLDGMELELNNAQNVKNQITQANLRLVVSVARKHLQTGVNLMELVSEGNITLMRAIDSFNTKKGVRFSTYATLALMKGFARSVPELKLGKRIGGASGKRITSFDSTEMDVADQNSSHAFEELANRDQVDQLLSVLPERERRALRLRFGFDESDAGDHALSPVARRNADQALERLRQVFGHSSAFSTAE